MSASLKMILFKGKTLADGTHPIQLQFYVNGKPKRKSVYKCHAKDWDSKLCRVKSKSKNSAYINNYLSEVFIEAERQLFKVNKGEISAATFFNPKSKLTLRQAFELELRRLEGDLKTAPYRKVESFINQLPQFTDIDSIRVSDIDLYWFEEMATKMKGIGNKASTVQKKIKTIRSIIVRFSDKEVSQDIKDFKVPAKRAIKQKWTENELARFENLVLPEDSMLKVVQDFFMLQIYLRGSRVGALLMAYSEQFKDGRYNAITEDGKNNVGAKLIPKAQEIVDRYYGKYERLFPIFQFTPNPKLSDFMNKRNMIKKKESCTSIINNNLKKLSGMADIEKPASSHLARHIYTKKAIGKINNPMITMELLGHKSLAVHQGYLNDIRRDDVLDQANQDIFED
jgi:integrase/recombinase XerD